VVEETDTEWIASDIAVRNAHSIRLSQHTCNGDSTRKSSNELDFLSDLLCIFAS
jgi:hypothetical protein